MLGIPRQKIRDDLLTASNCTSTLSTVARLTMEFQCDPTSRVPIYRQLMDQIRQAVARGRLRPGAGCRRCACCRASWS